jgi:hypothetical protein
MTIKNPLKRVIAGALAVLVMACSIPANADLGGFFGGSDIVASAETSDQSETIATITGEMGQKTTFTGTKVTITAKSGGDSAGMILSTWADATISVADGYIITKAEFTNGFAPWSIERFSSEAGNVTISGDVATVSDVNAQSLTVSGTNNVQIKQVTVYYEKTEWAVGENINLDGKWFITDDMDITRVHGKNSSVAVPNPIYDGNKDQWRFGSCISIDQYSREPSGDLNPYKVKISLNIKKPSDKSSADKPSGFKIKSGSGTQADPYTFELVYPSKVDVTGVKLDKTAVTIPYGGTEPLTLTATVDPDDAADKTVTWASSDTTVATVDANGKVTAVKAGTATITATATNGTADDTTDDKTATCTVTVSKIDPNLKTAPAAIEGLTYNGEPQDLITAGTSDDGTVQYAVVETDDDTPEYTLVKRDSPDALELADVKVNTVCTPDLEGEYKGLKGIKFSSGNYIIDDISYTDIRLCYSTDLSKYYLMSNKGPLALSEGIDGLLITDIESGKVYAEFVNTANPVVEPQIDEQAWVEVIPKETDAGEYDVYYRVKGDDNHNNTKPVKIEGTMIGKGAPTLTDPKAVEGLVEDGTAKKLVTEGSTEDGQLQYALGTDAKTEPESSTFGAEVPEMTKAGTYYVWYRVIGDTNHTDSQAKCITVTISEKKSDDSSKTDSSKSDSNSGGSNDGANDSSTTPDTGFNGSVTGAAATLMGAAALAAVSVIAAKKKKEDK